MTGGRTTRVPVLVSGGGPSGLAAAIELGRRGIEVVVVEPRTTLDPLRARAKTTSVRTMEHLRRWGLADRLRSASPIPVAHAQDVVFCTGLLGHEITRFPEADLVANPGCYPTATLIALAPLACEGVIEDVVVDAKSGVSGAGRRADDSTHFVSADENVTPYGVAGHRHSPEIDQELAALGAEVPATFTPHLLPLDQGELVSCYVTPRREMDDAELRDLYAEAYRDEPFVELAERPPGVREVRDTNICRIFTRADERTGKLLAFASIDNLWKGAASQAVQNLNLMFGRPEGEGIS